MVSNLIDKDGRQSKGVLLLRTLAMPSDTNANGDIFGGWIMSQMDMGGAILAKEIAHGRVVTVAVESMNFIKPIAVGDVVCCYGQCLSVGRSSIKIKVEVWVKKVASEPIGERFMFWNFVSSSKDRLEQAKEDWQQGRMTLPVGDDQEYIPLPDPRPEAPAMS